MRSPYDGFAITSEGLIKYLAYATLGDSKSSYRLSQKVVKG